MTARTQPTIDQLLVGLTVTAGNHQFRHFFVEPVQFCLDRFNFLFGQSLGFTILGHTPGLEPHQPCGTFGRGGIDDDVAFAGGDFPTIADVTDDVPCQAERSHVYHGLNPIPCQPVP